MRPPQNKRMRGRNNNNNNSSHRRNSNSLTRSYESNGPDIKVRGTAAHIAEKYVQLARDAHVAGDPVAAESYLQHAEHYFRLIASIHAAQNPQPRQSDGSLADQMTGDESDDDDFDGGINDRFTYRSPQAYQAPAAGQPLAAGQPYAGNEQASASGDVAEQPALDQPYGDPRQENGRQDSRQDGRQDNSRQDGRQDNNRNQNRFDNRNGSRFDNRNGNRNNRDFARQDGNRQDMNRPDGNRQDSNRQDGNRFDNRRDRNPRNDRPDYRAERSEGQARYENGRQDFNRPDQARTDQARTDQARPDQARTDQARVDQPWQDQPRSESNRPDRGPRPVAPEIAGVQPILPSFITAPVRAVPIVDAETERTAAVTHQAEDAPAPRKRGRRKIVAANEDGDPAVETPAAE